MAECREGPTGVILGAGSPEIHNGRTSAGMSPAPDDRAGAVNNTGAYRRGYVTVWFPDDRFHRCRNDQDHDGVWDEARGTQ